MLTRTSLPLFLAATLLACGSKGASLPEPWSKVALPERARAKEITAGYNGQPKAQALRVVYPKLTDFAALCLQYRSALVPVGFAFDREKTVGSHMVIMQMTRGGEPYRIECGYFASQEIATVEIARGSVAAE